MAKRFLTDINLSGSQILSASFEKLASAPATNLFEGRMYYDTALDIVRVYDGAKWVDSGIPIVTADPATGNYEGRIVYNTTADAIKFYNGSTWDGVGAGSITSISNSDGNITVTGTTAVSIDLPATIDANTTGNAATATLAATATVANSVAANSVALTTDTTGDYVATIGGTDGVSISGAGTEGRAVTIANTDKGSSQNIFKNVAVSGQNTIVADTNNDTLTVAAGTGITITTVDTTDTLTVTNAGVTSLTGTANQVSVSGSTGSVTLSTPQNIHTGASPTFAGATLDAIQVGITAANEIDTTAGNLTIDSAGGTVTVDDNLIVSGDLTVSGTTTTVNTETINLADNIITLNSNEAGAPTQNAGLEIERGTLTNVVFRWNETSDKWEITEDGTNYNVISVVGHTHTSANISDFTEAAQDAIGTIVFGSNSLAVTYNDATPSITFDTTLAGTSYLTKTSGLAVDKTALETALTTDGYTKKFSASVGNGALTSIGVTHNLGTRDVVVNVYDNATYDTVEVDVVRTDTNTVTVSFATAPSTNAYRVVVIG
jgi:hypothetical protein